ncbi:MAG: VOC family protein [Alphaproteobacteria bacterium]|nr:VOC family protein [Alphaproteobacteria bacterium]
MATIRYIVSDVGAAVAFYTGHLGFRLRQQFGPAMAILERDDLRLWVAGPPASASQPMPDGRKPEPGGWNRFVVEVPDLAGLVARLKAAGVPFRNEIVSGPGGQQILCEDPSGNAIELFQPARPGAQ